MPRAPWEATGSCIHSSDQADAYPFKKMRLAQSSETLSKNMCRNHPPSTPSSSLYVGGDQSSAQDSSAPELSLFFKSTSPESTTAGVWNSPENAIRIEKNRQQGTFLSRDWIHLSSFADVCVWYVVSRI